MKRRKCLVLSDFEQSNSARNKNAESLSEGYSYRLTSLPEKLNSMMT